MDQRLVLIEAGEDEVAAVFVPCHGRQGGSIQAVEGSRDRLRLQAQVLGGEQDFGVAESLARCLELICKLVRISGDLVEARQHHQAGEASVQCRTGWGGNAWGFLF